MHTKDTTQQITITANQLVEGNFYSRNDLKKLFNISDATIRNGVFKPKNHNSVWLFVTEKKSSDMTPYNDLLEGNTLNWDGQTEGRTDYLIATHKELGLELLLFYRKSKEELSFCYKGRFLYKSHNGSKPTHFILEKEDSL
jgi:hypothetical protein